MSRHLSSSSGTRRARSKRWLKAALIGVLVVANLAVGAILWTIREAESAFRANVTQEPEVAEALTERTASGDPLFMLLIGSDSREGVDADVYGSFAGERSDVVMVARLDPGGGTAQLLSIPRDTLVDIEGHGEGKINAAFSVGGAELMVETVADAFDLPIHHYVEVDFVGFQSLVDQLGGVPMTFEHAARDAKSHLDVPAGSITLSGEQALAYARSRTYQELVDGAWRSVEASDIGRAGRQQELAMAILSRLESPSTVTESGEIVESIARHLTVDPALAEGSLASLAFEFRGIDPGSVEAATLPTVGASRSGASVQLLDQPAASSMLAAFRSGGPMDIDPTVGSVTVRVLNGNGVTGSAGRWAADLERAGFTIADVADAADVVDETTVIVANGAEDVGESLVSALGFGDLRTGALERGVDAVVVLGPDAERETS